MDFSHPQVLALIELAIQEDLGPGDYSSLASINRETQGKSVITFKQNGVVAGLGLAAVILKRIDPDTQLEILIPDGEYAEKGAAVAKASGRAQSLLAAERLILNFMQRLSAIATKTREVVQLLEGSHTKILDTRKTTPGMRLLEKWAVSAGGGLNHRIGLYDMVMLKDNHIDSSGGIPAAVHKTVEYLRIHNLNLKIEVETRNLNEVRQALETGKVDRIMLDNFSSADCKLAVDEIAGRTETEASGGITLANIREYAASGVDFISLGYLTHSAGSIDISMKTQMV